MAIKYPHRESSCLRTIARQGPDPVASWRSTEGSPDPSERSPPPRPFKTALAFVGRERTPGASIGEEMYENESWK